MRWRRCFVTSFVATLLAMGFASTASALTPIEQLGKILYFDVRLSQPAGQSCATCHSPGNGFNGIGDANLIVYEGVVPGRFGNRNPPAAAYASFSPVFHFDAATGLYVGGQFWDGRAATLAAQAKGPFLNPAEQNNPSAAAVVSKVCFSSYASLFSSVFPRACSNVTTAYNKIAEAIAAYESAAEVNRFSSKFDCVNKGGATFTTQEANGLVLFDDPAKGNCAACHPSMPGPYAPLALFTDYTYDNLGIPKNPRSPWYTSPLNPAGFNYVDLGLGAIVADLSQNGKFKVPTLRNVGVAAPFGHNGYFTTLKEIVHFYNTRDVPAAAWPAAEVPATVNHVELGNLGLTGTEEDDIVAFLMTLTDGYYCGTVP